MSRWGSIGVVAVLASACASPESAVRVRFANEYACTDGTIEVRTVGDYAYRATGCGRTLVYLTSCVAGTCTIRHDGPVMDAPVAASPEAPPPEAPWSNAEILAMHAHVHDRVLACFSPAHLPARMRVSIGRHGAVMDMHPLSDAEPTEVTCARHALENERLEGNHPLRTVSLVFAARRAGDETPPGDTLADASPPQTAEASPSTDAETAVRDAIDAHASAVLVCTSGASVGVVASWTADGATTFELRGDAHDSPEEGCVQRALASVRAPASEAAGTILQAVIGGS